MIEAFRKIWRFAGEERANINKSAAIKFLNAVFHMLEVSAVYFIIVALTQGKTGSSAAWSALPKISRPMRVTSWRQMRGLRLEIS